MSPSPPSRVDGPLFVTDALTIPAAELNWRFSRSSGPGGQGVNTADSRVELTWSPARSAACSALSEHLRRRLLGRLESRLVGGDAVVIAASEYRAQLRNREAARRRLASLIRESLAPAPPKRRSTRPTRGSNERRLAGKKARSMVKSRRRKPGSDY